MQRFLEAAHIVDTGVGGAIYFEDVFMGTVADGTAAFAIVTRIRGWPLVTVEGFGIEPGCGGFADTAHASEDDAVMLPAKLNGIG